MGITEDELASAIIDYHNEDAAEFDDIEDCRVYPEAHYNHYGDRGVADLYIVEEYVGGATDGHVYELKSESAVKEATGANEIVRQFNKMREYFFKGSSHKGPDSLTFELCFTPTAYNLRHVVDNLSIYQSTVDQKLTDAEPKVKKLEMADGSTEWVERLKVLVTTRPPDGEHITPIQFCNVDGSMPKEYNFSALAKGMNPLIHDEFEEVFAEITAEYSSE
ncbi:hypothetical protein OB919_18775 [Halobacteria archaeon AArc-curdl1]|uniref:Uncharacterized protein n=1 Tax=Natronosalvus hydrolyticus TaxID=2979988 RepID=A0AAP2ZB64_9EURY|nr:hypothetical protein [Halobacteria archaeon AArc-curdl1]